MFMGIQRQQGPGQIFRRTSSGAWGAIACRLTPQCTVHILEMVSRRQNHTLPLNSAPSHPAQSTSAIRRGWGNREFPMIVQSRNRNRLEERKGTREQSFQKLPSTFSPACTDSQQPPLRSFVPSFRRLPLPTPAHSRSFSFHPQTCSCICPTPTLTPTLPPGNTPSPSAPSLATLSLHLSSPTARKARPAVSSQKLAFGI